MVSFLLRVGISIVFLYAGISSLLNPDGWIGFIPLFITSIIPANTFLIIYSIFQILLSLWLLSGKQIFWASILAALTLILIITFNLESLDLIFRDIPIFLSSIALILLSRRK